jgi:hypothetical protein
VEFDPSKEAWNRLHRILSKVDFIKGLWHKIPPQIVEFDPARRPGTDFHISGKVDFIMGQ